MRVRYAGSGLGQGASSYRFDADPAAGQAHGLRSILVGMEVRREPISITDSHSGSIASAAVETSRRDRTGRAQGGALRRVRRLGAGLHARHGGFSPGVGKGPGRRQGDGAAPDVVFAVTGITPGESLEGVKYFRGGADAHGRDVDRAPCGKIHGHHPCPRARSRAAGLPALTDLPRNQTDDVLRIVNRRGGVPT
jgi:hypothetical protein